jgi:hypothetical protein
MVPIEPRPVAPSTLDPEAVRLAIQQARRLYVSPYSPAPVTDVTEQLRDFLQAAIPECEQLAARMPNTRLRQQALDSTRSARHLLAVGVGDGPMSALVHMQLLADSAGVLLTRLRDPHLGDVR